MKFALEPWLGYYRESLAHICICLCLSTNCLQWYPCYSSEKYFRKPFYEKRCCKKKKIINYFWKIVYCFCVEGKTTDCFPKTINYFYLIVQVSLYKPACNAIFGTKSFRKVWKLFSKYQLRVLGDILLKLREVDQDSLKITMDSYSWKGFFLAFDWGSNQQLVLIKIIGSFCNEIDFRLLCCDIRSCNSKFICSLVELYLNRVFKYSLCCNLLYFRFGL